MFERSNLTIRDFQNAITEKDIEKLIHDDQVKLIRPWGGYVPSERDLHLLDVFFKARPDVEFRVTSPGMLKWLPDVQFVSEAIEGNFGEKLEDLQYLRQVRGVCLVEKDISPLLAYRSTLEKLSLEGRLRKRAEDVLFQLSQLHSLSLISTNLESFACIAEAPLRSLYVYGNKPTDPSLIKELSELREIHIKTNSSWSDFDFLSHLKKLESIQVEYCSKIRKVASLEGLNDLKYVNFSSCNRLEDISALWKLSYHCEVLATGSRLSEEKISYHYEPGYGLQDWCKQFSTNLPLEILER